MRRGVEARHNKANAALKSNKCSRHHIPRLADDGWPLPVQTGAAVRVRLGGRWHRPPGRGWRRWLPRQHACNMYPSNVHIKHIDSYMQRTYNMHVTCMERTHTCINSRRPSVMRHAERRLCYGGCRACRVVPPERWLSPLVCDPSSIIHHPLSIIHHLSSIIHHPSSIIHHLETHRHHRQHVSCVGTDVPVPLRTISTRGFQSY